MKTSPLKRGIAASVLLSLCPIPALAGASPAPGGARAVDLGSLQALGRGGETMSVTLSLGLSDPAGAETMMARLATPGDALYHQFLTPAEIRATFGPNEADMSRAMSVLRLGGFEVERATSTTLKVTGTVSTLERVFDTALHQFSVAATDTTRGVSFRAATVKPTVPSAIATVVQGLVGFNNAPRLKSHVATARTSLAGTPISHAADTAGDGTPFGALTVKDFANFYDVNPIYAQGITGAGRTLAIVSFAAFTPSDVQAYWDSLNLATKPNRITVVTVDGGSGPPSDAAGSQETTLDVEQSGGIAPMADIIVYEAPFTIQGFVDNFAKAAEDNIADSVSVSAGFTEFEGTTSFGTVTDAFDGETESALQAMHEAFVLMALEGQSMFAAAGDSGAFDTVEDFGTTGITFPLSVDYPSSDPAVTAAGGTTLPGTQTVMLPNTTVTLTVPQERVWGDDYMEPVCAALGTPDPVACGIFSEGTGGGVSVIFGVPATQLGLAGVQLSQPGQAFIETDTTPPTDLFDLAADFPGRNVPDLSFNADPATGYELFYTSSVVGFGVFPFFGGTSFVAPQLNGVAALLGQNAGHRFGLFTVPIYALARSGIATLGPTPALHTITTGDNWFYTARDGYSPAGGLGTIEVANLAKLLK
jgi:subtilase family serine protease